MSDWKIYRGDGVPHDGIGDLPAPPNWRDFRGEPVMPPIATQADGDAVRRLGTGRRPPDPATVQMINAALYLRRPLLVTGKPGVGKSSLAYDVAQELQLGRVLSWPISSRSTLADGLYAYDPVGRLREESIRNRTAKPTANSAKDDDTLIGKFLTLGPLGTALLPFERPRVLLIDEIDKSDIDLPNDLLNVFEDGEYVIPELRRVAARTSEVEVLTADDRVYAQVQEGRVRCRAFPFIVMTSNDEREFPPAFLRRCLRLNLNEPQSDQIAAMVESHLGPETATAAREMIDAFATRRTTAGVYATDQILSAVYLRFSRADADGDAAMIAAVDAVLNDLNNPAQP